MKSHIRESDSNFWLISIGNFHIGYFLLLIFLDFGNRKKLLSLTIVYGRGIGVIVVKSHSGRKFVSDCMSLALGKLSL